jgi:capsular exopolysaccharide synthesis family protein
VIVAGIVGLILGVFLAFFRAFFNDKIESQEDIEKATTVPIVANIPHISGDANEIVVLKSTKSMVAESFRALRTNLQFMAKDNSSQVIALTSTISGEGKTTIAVNLAAIFSLTGKKVVILNIDMRKPTLHNKFKLTNARGVSTYLIAKNSLEEVIQHSNYENLDVITSGPIPPNPSELIDSKKFKELIENLKNIYDVIVLDTPPIGLVTDARVVLELADSSLYIIRVNYSKKEFINNVNNLQKYNIKGLGIVINGIKASKKGYGYGNGYGYYN